MTPLSHDLPSLILPYDHFESHLNTSGKTTDPELEKANFRKSRQILAEVWSQAIIDSFRVHAQYVDPENIPDLPVPTAQWYF